MRATSAVLLNPVIMLVRTTTARVLREYLMFPEHFAMKETTPEISEKNFIRLWLSGLLSSLSVFAVVRQLRVLTNTPKALANFSPGLECSDNPGLPRKERALNPERVCCGSNPFRV